MIDEPASEGSRSGLYSNYFEVGYNAYQFVIQCGEGYADARPPALHTRIITGPTYAKALWTTLGNAVAEYEQEYGALSTADLPPSGQSGRDTGERDAEAGAGPAGAGNIRGTTMADERTARTTGGRGEEEGNAAADAMSGIEKLRSDVGRRQKTLDELRREMDAVERELRESERELAEREATEREIDAATSSLTNGLSAVTAAFQSLKDLLAAEAPVAERDLGDARADLDREIAAVHARVAKRADRRHEIEDDVAGLRRELAEARRHLAAAEQDYEARKTPPSDLGDRLTEIASLRQRLNRRESPYVRYAVIAELRRLEADFEAHRPSASEHRKALIAGWDRVRDARAKVRDLEERLTKLSAELQKVSSEVDDLQRTRLARILERVEVLAANREAAAQ